MTFPRISAGSILCVAAALPGGGPGRVVAQESAPSSERVVRVLDRWIAAYRAGKLDLRDRRDVSGRSMVVRAGLAAPRGRTPWTRVHELRALLDAAAAVGDAACVRRVLEIAGTGLEPFPYERRHAPALVRTLGEAALLRFRRVEAQDTILRIARGDAAGERERKAGRSARRAAALRALGALRRPAFRPALEEGLRAKEPVVRLAAADGLARLASPASADALVRALERERQEAAAIAMAGALVRILREHSAQIGAVVQRYAVRAAIERLGRLGWRADMAMLDVLETLRSRETVPALLGLLERFEKHPELVRKGVLSGLLRWRAYELLVSLSGAFFPVDRLDRWRSWWAREKDRFRVAPRRPERPASGPGATVSRGFFGIPVRGTRVVFVIDVSGSMGARRFVRTAAGGDADRSTAPTRLDVAREQLLQAVDSLSPESSFNVVVFSEDVETWRKDLVAANARNKKALRKYLRKLRPRRSTNLWGGIEAALKIRSLVVGDRYASNVDEVFVLSDGAPTSGEILDPGVILRTVTETNRFSRVRINTVFLGRAPGGHGPQAGLGPARLMEELATANGGRFVLPR